MYISLFWELIFFSPFCRFSQLPVLPLQIPIFFSLCPVPLILKSLFFSPFLSLKSLFHFLLVHLSSKFLFISPSSPHIPIYLSGSPFPSSPHFALSCPCPLSLPCSFFSFSILTISSKFLFHSISFLVPILFLPFSALSSMFLNVSPLYFLALSSKFLFFFFLLSFLTVFSKLLFHSLFFLVPILFLPFSALSSMFLQFLLCASWPSPESSYFYVLLSPFLPKRFLQVPIFHSLSFLVPILFLPFSALSPMFLHISRLCFLAISSKFLFLSPSFSCPS